ncbi:VWA domain-containing protein [Ktedonospora formicarum]|uniref:VWA domain-containing protein n=2 Tax=Ktedonospora formicarum TaxID=2778364 RepID=A0A8J3IB30_9CHLR|nr:VWA domain-containing protein [Ktedonospora formicarum]
MQAVLSLQLDDTVQLTPAPLALAIALDQSASMSGPKMRAARDGAIKVIEALDENILFLIVPFNDTSNVLFGPALGTPGNKRKATSALQRIDASYGTCMSKALDTIVTCLESEQARACKILFLTDGKNEGEPRARLDAAIERCRAANMSVSAWGVGTDWDAAELRHMADATHGSADIIPHPQQIASAFTASFQEMRKTAIPHARLGLWCPAGVTITHIQQVYPNIVACTSEPDATNPRQVLVSLGSFAAGEQRDYLLDLEIPVHEPGMQFLMARPSVLYLLAGGSEQVQKSTQEGWVFVQWTDNLQLAAQIEDHIAHYTNQEALSRNLKEGQEALVAGDVARATKLLGDALIQSEQSGNDKITRLLSNLVLRDAKGTIRLNTQADAVARKTLAINVGQTTKLK